MDSLQTQLESGLEECLFICSDLLNFPNSVQYSVLLAVTVNYKDSYLLKLQGNQGTIKCDSKTQAEIPLQLVTEFQSCDAIQKAVQTNLINTCKDYHKDSTVYIQGMMSIITDNKQLRMVSIDQKSNKEPDDNIQAVSEEVSTNIDEKQGEKFQSCLNFNTKELNLNANCGLIMSIDLDNNNDEDDEIVDKLGDEKCESNIKVQEEGENINDSIVSAMDDTENSSVNVQGTRKSLRISEKKLKKKLVKYECDSCGEMFKLQKELKIHMKSFHEEGDFSCSFCGKVYKHAVSLKKHKETHENPWKCDMCNKEFAREKYLLDHKCIGTNFTCSICNVELNSYHKFYRHRQLHEEQVYSCDQCDKQFNLASKLSQHKRVHRIGRFVCEICGHRFNQSGGYSSHLRVHTGEKPYQCRFCTKTFRSKTQLNTHERTHTGVKPYICSTCGKAFRTSTKLNDHERIHSGQKPFSCDLCKKSFRIKSNLVKHRKIHTGQPYVCEKCGKRFARIGYLNTHLENCSKEKYYGLNPPKTEEQEVETEIEHESNRWQMNDELLLIDEHIDNMLNI